MPGAPAAKEAPAMAEAAPMPDATAQAMPDEELPDFGKMSKDELAAFIAEMEGKDGGMAQEELDEIFEELGMLEPEAAIEVIEALPISEEQKKGLAERLEQAAQKG